MAIVRSGNNTTIYIDGTPDGSWNDTTAVQLADIGNNILNEGYGGQMDDFRVYRRALGGGRDWCNRWWCVSAAKTGMW